MSTDYLTEVAAQKKYVGNVVILINGQYFAIRKPDSGLEIAKPFDRCIQSLVLNPTTIDLRRVTTTIASYSFKLVDKYNVITAIMQGDGAPIANAQVDIWLGRSDVDMDFSDYYKLPTTRVSKITHQDNSYNISSTEETDRMDRPIYAGKSATAVDILAATTIITMRDSLANFPSPGMVKLEDEFISYTGIDTPNNRFTGCVRGELGSTPADHEALSDALQVETLTDNPLNILLKLLISGGGGGSYDTLQSGLGISESLIDVSDIESLRDSLFDGDEFTLSFYSITSALKFIETELLTPNNLRFKTSRNSKISVAVLDKAVFVDATDLIDEDSITKYPQWTVDITKITNSLEIQWDYDEPTNQFRQRTVATNDDSIAAYGESTPLKFSFKGIKARLDGQTLVDDFTKHLLDRLSTPTPEIQMNTQIDKSLQNIGDKTLVESSQIPSANGTLNFASELEIVSRSINVTNGDVQFKLAFTSFTNIRSCYIAPSDSIASVISQKKITVGAGRGTYYSVGWKMRLWDSIGLAYEPDIINTINDVTGDTITFENDFVTTLDADHKIKFADYDDVSDSQKRYCFISDGGANFADGKPTYKVTY